MTSKSPVGDISVVTLIRTDTTLDHSQKAEKVWSSLLEIMVPQLGKAPRRWLEMLRIELARVASSLAASRRVAFAHRLGTKVPAKIRIVTLMRPIHGNL